MLALLLESALRSLLLGGAVWLGLKLLRVKNPHAHMTAWTLVLVASLAMPALMRLVTVTIPTAGPAPLAQIIWPTPAVAPPALERGPQAAGPIVSAPAGVENQALSLPAEAAEVAEVAVRRELDWRPVATAVYALVAGMLLVRLLIGVALTWRLVRAARPVRACWAAGLDVRVSDVIGVPVTFGSTILLPTEYVAWNAAKRRAVLTHERAHVIHADFYVLLLAALNRAVFWFNPFAWWQLARLAELAEIISDDAALEALEDRPRYAGILLDVARRRQHAPAALAMARPATVGRRVERILAAREAPARANWRQRLLVAGALLPLVAVCAVTIAHGTPPASSVQATAGTPEQSGASMGRYAGFYQASPRTVLTIAADGEHLSAHVTGQPPLDLARASDTDYVSAAPAVRVSFVFDGEAPANALVVRHNNREWRAGRIDAAKAAAIEATFAARIAAAPERFHDQLPAPGGREAALRLIEQVQRSAPGEPLASMQLGEPVRLQLPQLRRMLIALGPLQSLFFRGVGPGGYDIYGAQFANGSADFRLGLAADGTIEDILFRPNGDGRPGELIACEQEQSLASAGPTVPIRVLLFNGSGADVQMVGLEAGQRKTRATIGDNSTGGVFTYVGQPLIVADAVGRCIGIVSPGVLTRVLMVQTGRDGAPFVTARSARAMPRSGSEEALRRHIEAVGRGTPHYEEMTEEAAVETRQQLLLDQAILARLGPLRAMSFRAVSPFDNDVFMGQFANGTAEWRIRLVDDGRIGGIALGPQY